MGPRDLVRNGKSMETTMLFRVQGLGLRGWGTVAAMGTSVRVALVNDNK